ncbi:MAG: class I SAM-dependent methyltransferase [Bacteroidota bacterium]
MYEKLEVCPACRNTNFTNFLICTDHLVSGESFALNLCNKCGLVFTNPRPNEESIHKYYLSNKYLSHTNKSGNLLSLLYKLVRVYTIKKKIKLIQKYTENKTILDYGCGTGDFLQACKKAGFRTFGLEPNENAKTQAQKKDLHLISNLKDLKERVDIITAWHVIEHVHDLKSVIRLLKKNLNNDGILFIAVPNMKSYDALYYKEHWAAYDVPRHLYHFTQESFGKLIAKNKFKLIDTVPMIFDSFYISILSEKYMTGRNNYVKSIKTAYESNRKAKRNGEYSSITYILKK